MWDTQSKSKIRTIKTKRKEGKRNLCERKVMERKKLSKIRRKEKQKWNVIETWKEVKRGNMSSPGLFKNRELKGSKQWELQSILSSKKAPMFQNSDNSHSSHFGFKTFKLLSICDTANKQSRTDDICTSRKSINLLTKLSFEQSLAVGHVEVCARKTVSLVKSKKRQWPIFAPNNIFIKIRNEVLFLYFFDTSRGHRWIKVVAQCRDFPRYLNKGGYTLFITKMEKIDVGFDCVETVVQSWKNVYDNRLARTFFPTEVMFEPNWTWEQPNISCTWFSSL